MEGAIPPFMEVLMDTINFTSTEKDHIDWLVSQHKIQVLALFNNTEDEKEREILNLALKVDRDICDKLWNDKEKQLDKMLELKKKLEKVKK